MILSNGMKNKTVVGFDYMRTTERLKYKHHRRNQQAGQQSLAAEIGAGQTNRRQGAEEHGDQRRGRRNDQAVGQRACPFRRGEEDLVPAHGEAPAAGVIGKGTTVERQCR